MRHCFYEDVRDAGCFLLEDMTRKNREITMEGEHGCFYLSYPWTFLLTPIGIRNYTVGLIVKLSSDEVTLQQQKTLLGKLNMVLVQVRLGNGDICYGLAKRAWL